MKVDVSSQIVRTCIGTNGTAVEGVCVTGAASRVHVLFESRETVPVARQYGAIFAPGLTERSERQASQCARALSRSRYK